MRVFVQFKIAFIEYISAFILSILHRQQYIVRLAVGTHIHPYPSKFFRYIKSSLQVNCERVFVFNIVRAMNAKESEANQSSEKTVQNGNKNNHRNSAAPSSYDEVICSQQYPINGRHHGRDVVERQPTRMDALQCTRVFTTRPLVGLYSENLFCPFCQDRINTRVEYVTTDKTHFNAMICCAM